MKYFTFVCLLVSIASTLVAGAFLDFFSAHSDGNNITVEWKTRVESSLNLFEVQRKAGTNGEYTTLEQIQPKGSYSYYSFTDRSAYKTTDNVYTYRLKIVDEQSLPSYSNEVVVSHNVSSVKRTWGSIKAMFR